MYYVFPHKLRWVLLSAASYYFYMSWEPAYVILLAVSTLSSYLFARGMGSTPSSKRKKLYLWLTVGVNLGILLVFKYFNFFRETMDRVLHSLGFSNPLPVLNVLLPVGISFYTFQVLSYIIDVYRGDKEPEKHPGIYAAYVSFFPQLVAGPIERSTRFLPQFFEKHRFRFDLFADGMRLLIWGFFKKLLIADNLGRVVDTVYNNPGKFEGIHFIVATVCFAFQVFCDFSGYSDIAVGAARVMGFRLMTNFNRPYHAKTVSEFWTRWHISLSTWLRDYLFLPTAYALMRKTKRPAVLKVKTETWGYIGGMAVTMFLGGLWHGAGWTFVLWGLLHAVYLIFGHTTKKIRRGLVRASGIKRVPALYNLLRTAVTFTLVSFAWIFFRARDISDALYIVTHIFSGLTAFISGAFDFIAGLTGHTLAGFLFKNELGLPYLNILIVSAAVLVMEAAHLAQKKRPCIAAVIKTRPLWIRWGVYYTLIFWTLVFGNFNEQAFIYFQF